MLSFQLGPQKEHSSFQLGPQKEHSKGLFCKKLLTDLVTDSAREGHQTSYYSNSATTHGWSQVGHSTSL